MTDKEKAEKWWNNWAVKDWNDIKEGKGLFIQAFLAGLKAGRTQWHDLREDPTDLPKDSHYVWTNESPGYHDDDGWWDDLGRLNSVIAWCEPKFEEEDMNKNITNKQLAEWLAAGKGEWKHEPSHSGKVYDFYWFDPKDADKQVTLNGEGQRIMVRKYGELNWHSPTEDYCLGNN